MRRFGAVAAVGAGLVVLALAVARHPAGAASDGATVTGKVKLVGKAPANPAIDMGEEPKCKGKYTTGPVDPAVLAKNGMLANVFVYVKTGLPADAKYPAPSTPVEIDQNGCLYHPRVFGIMVGQGLSIKNSDGVLHNIKALGKKNRPFNISQPTNMVTQRPGFTVTEVMLPFECNVHGWMHAFAGVQPHPFFATTGEDGSFALKGLPPGTYTIEAWHEKFGVQTATVTVKAGETKASDFTFTAK
ncbi:MAG TPA: carboxypeptidase regulatory-like domain-containing protein [Gemmatimonadales bacterium]|nr:carboxypeptidase regulatory-like domain-containing protein [Gemmatimonadales bacterium]